MVESEFSAASLDVSARIAVLKALADRTRLQVVHALLARPHCAEELAERLRRPPSTVAFHLRKLDEAGLVDKQKAQYYVVYALRKHLLDLTLRAIVALPPAGDAAERRRLDKYRQGVLKAFFKDGALVQLPKQWRKRRIVLEPFVAKFEAGRAYDEHEVNERIHTLFDDHCTIRRLLVDEGLMTRDAGTYRLLAQEPAEEATMETRKDLKRQFKETPKRAGVYCIKNTKTGKVFFGSSTNLHGPFNKHRFLLTHGLHPNAALQADWKALGADAFAFELLEVVKPKDDPSFSVTDELGLLEDIWMDRLRPVAPHGYNEDARVRE